jgi:polyisoprenoid-binding protein YceI
MSPHAMARQRAPRRILLVAGLVIAGASFAPAQAPAQDSLVYRLLPSSRFEVRTGTTGLFAFVGHSHVVRARAFTGSVRYRPGALSTSRLEITVPAVSLEVLTPHDPAEIRQVTETMRTQVLHVDKYPEIRFTVTRATRTAMGVRLDGELTLVGRTRPVQVDAAIQVGPDTLRARGTFAVNQTDFGIKPYRGGPGGVVRVADRVTFNFDAVGVREPVRAIRHAHREGTTRSGSRGGGR